MTVKINRKTLLKNVGRMINFASYNKGDKYTTAVGQGFAGRTHIVVETLQTNVKNGRRFLT